MQSAGPNVLPHPLCIHLEPEEPIKSSVTVEFSVKQIPFGTDPEVSCHKSNGCFVFEGYCPIDTQIPLSDSRIRSRNINNDNQQEHESIETAGPYNPLVLWDVIPAFLRDIINTAEAKVMSMDNRKLPPGVRNLPAGCSFRDEPVRRDTDFDDTIIPGETISEGVDALKFQDELQQMGQPNGSRTLACTERDRPTLIYPAISVTEITSDHSSDDLSVTNDPFEKIQLKTVGNVVENAASISAPLFIPDNLRTSEIVPDAADLVTQRKWQRREACPGFHDTSDDEKPNKHREKRVSAVLAAYTKSVPLQHRPQEYNIKKDTDGLAISISESDSGEIEVGVSDAGFSGVTGSKEEEMRHSDVACGTDPIDKDVSDCVLCGSPLHQRKQENITSHDKKTFDAGQPSRAMMDASASTTITKHTQKQREKQAIKEKLLKDEKNITACPVIVTRGQPSIAMVDTSTHKSTTEHIQKQREKQAIKEKLLMAEKEIVAHPVTTTQGQPSRGMMDASTLVSTKEDAQKQREKQAIKQKLLVNEKEITTFPVTISPGQPSRGMMDVSTQVSTKEDTQKQREKQAIKQKLLMDEKEIITQPVTTTPGRPLRAMADASASTTKEPQNTGKKRVEQRKSFVPDRNVAGFTTITSPGRPLRTMANATTSTTEEPQNPRQKQVDHENHFVADRNVAVFTSITSPGRQLGSALSVDSSKELLKPQRNDSERPRDSLGSQDIYRHDGSTVNGQTQRSDRRPSPHPKTIAKENEEIQHIFFRTETCPYAPSLSSLPLDDSDVEYVISRAQMAKASLPKDDWPCPTERWQHRCSKNSSKSPSRCPSKSPHSKPSG